MKHSLIEALLDTGFNGSILLPQQLINELALTKSGSVKCILADGTAVRVPFFDAEVDFFGKHTVKIMSADTALPLIGMDLLRHARTVLDPANNIVELAASQNA